MRGAHFARRVPRYPERFLPAPGTSMFEEFERRVPVRPARFVLGLEELLDLVPEGVRAHLTQAPLRLAIYLGRVEEVSAGGEITATVWETPSGREAVTTLAPSDPAIVPGAFDPAPVAGDALRIWTWMELSPNGSPVPRIFFEVVPAEGDPTDLGGVGEDLLAKLEERSP